MTGTSSTPRPAGDVTWPGGGTTPAPAMGEGADAPLPERAGRPQDCDPLADGSSPAGGHLADARQWRIALPAGTELLNANDRIHWAAKARVTKSLRWTTFCMARMLLVPQLERVHILAVYEPPDRRRRDPANTYPSVKACVDGLVDARVIPDDDASHVVGPDMRLGTDLHPKGRLVLVVTELCEGTPS